VGCCAAALRRQSPPHDVERWLLGRLRHRRFYSLAELNAAIGELLHQLNEERPIRGYRDTILNC